MPDVEQGQGQTADTGQGAGQGTGQQTQQGAQGQQGQQGAGSGTGQSTPPGFTYAEDRSRWIPPHRFGEVTTQAQTLKQQVAERDRQIAALTNSRQPEPADVERGKIKEAIVELFPSLKKFGNLSDEQLDRLLQTPDIAAQVQAQEKARWDEHAADQIDTLSGLVADSIGVEKLNQDQRDDLTEAFKRYVLANVQKEMQTTGATTTGDRYYRNDPTLLKEFAERYKNNWFEPARRKVVSGQVNRSQRVPSSGGHNTTTTTQRPQTFKTLDERIDFAAKLAQERGKTFERD